MNSEHQININCSGKDMPSTCLIDLFSLVTRLQAENIEKYIPQVLNADKLNTVSYKKGCYTGQEVIARTHYLGNVKKHVYLISIKNPEIHEKNIINKDGESVGELIGERFIYKGIILSHSILRDSCDFDELFVGKDVVEVIPMEDIV
jgi:folate-binding protein YgfZ